MMALRARFRRATPAPAPTPGGSFLYAVGPGGIEPIRRAGNPLFDAFHGIVSEATGDLSNDPAGWAAAYKRSAWAFRCVLVRAQTLAAVPLRLKGPDDQPLPDHPLARTFQQRAARLQFVTECDRLVFGPAYWEITRTGPVRLNPQTIERLELVSPGADRGYRQVINGEIIHTWAPSEIVHFRDYDPDDDFGAVSALALALPGITVTGAIGAFAQYFFSNGAMPAGILVSETPLTDSDKERVAEEWRRKFQGVENAHRTAILDAGKITYQPITPPLKDLAMTELREEERREIAAALGVPMTIALMTEAANYATSKQDYVNFFTLTIIPELALLTDIMNTDLLPAYGVPGVRVEAALDEVEALQEDRGEVTGRAATGFPAGVMSLNDALRLQQLEPITDPSGVERDYFYVGGKLIPRQALETGDLTALEPAPALPSFFGMHAPALPARPVPRVIEGQAVPRATVDIVVRAPDAVQGDTKRDVVLRDTMLRDVERWQRKVIKKGTDTPFEPDYLPDAVTAWLRSDLAAWDGETPREAWVRRAFDTAEALVRADGEDLASLEEFETYWRGIEGLFDALAAVFETAWQAVPATVAAALRGGGQAQADDALVAALSQARDTVTAALLGSTEEPGPLVAVFLAGAARGHELLAAGTAAKADPLVIDWTVIDQAARAWAQQYAGTMIQGINETTLTIFREKIAAWIDAGGSLEDLAAALEGELQGLDLPDGWSPGKLQWATSRERARLIAQTETTRAFHEGAVERWERAAVPEKKFRTANDGIVCREICRPLNNVVTGLREEWVHPKTGKRYGLPAHGGCRCFAAPTGLS